MYGLVIHGGIDGASHYVLWCRAAFSKSREAVYAGYRVAVRRFGRPSRVRADHAKEFSLIKDDMETHRGFNRGSFIAGSSQNNQRIEHFWRFLYEKVCAYFKHALLTLEVNGLLNRDNPVHIAAVVATFLPLLQEAINKWIAAWNLHKVRAINAAGRLLQAHVPSQRFQEFERASG